MRKRDLQEKTTFVMVDLSCTRVEYPLLVRDIEVFVRDLVSLTHDITRSIRAALRLMKRISESKKTAIRRESACE